MELDDLIRAYVDIQHPCCPDERRKRESVLLEVLAKLVIEREISLLVEDEFSEECEENNELQKCFMILRKIYQDMKR